MQIRLDELPKQRKTKNQKFNIVYSISRTISIIPHNLFYFAQKKKMKAEEKSKWLIFFCSRVLLLAICFHSLSILILCRFLPFTWICITYLTLYPINYKFPDSNCITFPEGVKPERVRTPNTCETLWASLLETQKIDMSFYLIKIMDQLSR